jgi:hypothetical protein
MSSSFTMWLIDTGKLDGCSLGAVWRMFQQDINNPGTVSIYLIYSTTTVPEYMWEKAAPSRFHLYLAYLDHQSWNTWCTYVRITG